MARFFQIEPGFQVQSHFFFCCVWTDMNSAAEWSLTRTSKAEGVWSLCMFTWSSSCIPRFPRAEACYRVVEARVVAGNDGKQTGHPAFSWMMHLDSK